jgi:VCBS repeat-containing protein
VDLDTSSASRGNCNVTVTNPDGQAATATGLLSTNTAPVAAADTYSTNKNTQLNGTSVLANDSDPDGDALSAVQIAGPAHGTLALAANGTFSYTPTSGYVGSDSFTYKASDGIAQSATTTVSLNVIDPVTNHAPVGAADNFAVPHAGTLNATSVLDNDTDADGDTLSATKLSDPAHGTLALAADGTFTYVADAAFIGSDSFTYEASDGALESDPVTVTLEGPADQAPVANPDTYAVPAAGGLHGSSVLANDTDGDGDALTATKTASPAHGTVTVNADGTFDYQATSGFSGTDTFSYKASDGRLSSAAATVTLNVAAPPPPNTGSGGGGGGSSGGDSSDSGTTATAEPVPVLTPPSVTSGTVVPIATAPSTTTTTPQRCVVPLLRRHTVRYARTKLTAAHCALGSITRVRSTSVRRGRIVRTVPSAGARRAAGARVALRIRQ